MSQVFGGARRLLLLGGALLLSCDAAHRQPHILMIVADDYGWNDIGYHQNAISGANPLGRPTTNAAAGIMRTPTLDRLAAEGVKLESYYVQPLCSPTRATLMTGRYPHHTGIGPDVIEVDHPYGAPAREVFLPAHLRDGAGGGYATHAVGKWHLGTCDEGYLPTERGFDSYVGYLAGGESYYQHAADFRNGTGGAGPALGAAGACVGHAVDGRYSAELFAAEAARIVAHHARQQPQQQPLFLYIAMQSVHNPYDVPPLDVNGTYPEIASYERRVYAGMVAELDAAVANITSAFEAAGLWNDSE
jgi:arylsulfatase B/arylsulfatase I/J